MKKGDRLVRKIVEAARQASVTPDEGRLVKLQATLENIVAKLIDPVGRGRDMLDLLASPDDDFPQLLSRAVAWAYPRSVRDDWGPNEGSVPVLMPVLLAQTQGTKRDRDLSRQQRRAATELASLSQKFAGPIGRDLCGVCLAANVGYAADYIVLGEHDSADALLDLLEVWGKGWFPLGMLMPERAFVILTKKSI